MSDDGFLCFEGFGRRVWFSLFFFFWFFSFFCFFLYFLFVFLLCFFLSSILLLSFSNHLLLYLTLTVSCCIPELLLNSTNLHFFFYKKLPKENWWILFTPIPILFRWFTLSNDLYFCTTWSEIKSFRSYSSVVREFWLTSLGELRRELSTYKGNWYKWSKISSFKNGYLHRYLGNLEKDK